MKVSELTGRKLDYWVARANGETHQEICGEPCPYNNALIRYSLLWEYAGPIIDREKINLHTDYRVDGRRFPFAASYRGENYYKTNEIIYGFSDSSYLEAAMRCLVASKFGDEVNG